MARLVPLARQKNRISETFGKNVMGITYIAPDFEDDLPLEFFLGDAEAGTE
jgi:hypothetical protein